jgi:hypothetical protein
VLAPLAAFYHLRQLGWIEAHHDDRAVVLVPFAAKSGDRNQKPE